MAYCPTLEISDYGDSVEEVRASIQDGIALAVETLMQEHKELPLYNISEQLVTTATVALPF